MVRSPELFLWYVSTDANTTLRFLKKPKRTGLSATQWTTSSTVNCYVGASNPTGLSNQINLSINGSRPSQNSFLIDGADDMQRGAALLLLAYPSIDSIAEFKVARSNFLPEHGRTSSGEVSIITRGGTNSLHGSAYEFFRNDKLNANNYFNNLARVPRPPMRWNDWGFTIGGPIQKNKTFFFYSQEWRHFISYTGFTSGELPTRAEMNGTCRSGIDVAHRSSHGGAVPIDAERCAYRRANCNASSPAGCSAVDNTVEQNWANFLLGRVNTFTEAQFPIHYLISQNEFEFFGQDEWRIRPNLTLDLGVRYSLFMSPTSPNHLLSTFDPNLYSASPAAAIQTGIGANAGYYVNPVDASKLPGLIQAGVKSPYGDAVAPTQKKDFAPRLGFAWDPRVTARPACVADTESSMEQIRSIITSTVRLQTPRSRR